MKMEVPADFKEEISKIARRKYELIVIGNTNVGKSTFLNQITKMKDFFNVSNNRETSCIWRFMIEPEQELPFQSLERRLLPDTDSLQSAVHNKQQVSTVKEITDIIKTYRKPAAMGASAKEEAKNGGTTTIKDDADGAADQVMRQRNIEMIIKRSPKLLIEVLESQTLTKGRLVTLNAFGMESQ